MFRSFLSSAILAAAAICLSAASAHGYGAVHAGCTTVNSAGGVQHYSASAATGRYGNVSHTGSTSVSGGTIQHTGSTSVSGAYGGSAYHSSSTSVYSPTAYRGYSAVGHTSTTSATGVVRYP